VVNILYTPILSLFSQLLLLSYYFINCLHNMADAELTDKIDLWQIGNEPNLCAFL
jgi:hypothetical protein